MDLWPYMIPKAYAHRFPARATRRFHIFQKKPPSSTALFPQQQRLFGAIEDFHVFAVFEGGITSVLVFSCELKPFAYIHIHTYIHMHTYIYMHIYT